MPFVRLDLGERPSRRRSALSTSAHAGSSCIRDQAFALIDRAQLIEPAKNNPSDPTNGGRGLPPIAEHLEHFVLRHEGVRLIVAHAGSRTWPPRRPARWDPGRLLRHLGLSAVDLLDLYRQVSAEQIVYASDHLRQPNGYCSPSGRRSSPASTTASCARCSERTRRTRQTAPPLPLTAPRGGTSLSSRSPFARIHHYISMAVPMLWLRQRDGVGALGLENASRERDGHRDEAVRIEELLSTGTRAVGGQREITLRPSKRIASMRTAIQLVNSPT